MTVAVEELEDSRFEQVLTHFYNYIPGGNIPPKRPRGRPSKVKPPTPAGVYKNTISDDEVNERVSDHDRRMIIAEYKAELAYGQLLDVELIQELADAYNLKYSTIFHLVDSI